MPSHSNAVQKYPIRRCARFSFAFRSRDTREMSSGDYRAKLFSALSLDDRRSTRWSAAEISLYIFTRILLRDDTVLKSLYNVITTLRRRGRIFLIETRRLSKPETIVSIARTCVNTRNVIKIFYKTYIIVSTHSWKFCVLLVRKGLYKKFYC